MIYAEIGSGKKGAARPQWDELLRSLRKGDTLMVTELSRLGGPRVQLSALLTTCPSGRSGSTFSISASTLGPQAASWSTTLLPAWRPWNVHC